MKREKQLSPVAFLQREVNTFLTNDQKKILKDVWEQAEAMEKKQKGYTKTDVEYMLYKCCDDLENNKRVFWDIDGLVNEIISTFKRE